MKHIHFLLFSLLIIMFLSTSCKRTDELGNNLGIAATEQKLKAGIKGRVTDQNHLPIKNAIVTAYGKVIQTDLNGEFVLQGLMMPKYFGYVKVEKENYFTGSRTFTVTKAGALNHVEIQLIPKTIRGTFASYTGASITFDGVNLTFEPNTIMHTNGTPYSGTVTVVGAYLNPEDPDLNLIMPGNLVGESPQGIHQGLTTFGMIAVELQTPSGEKLQILKDKTANISLPIQASQLSSAPTTIPLWYFEEQSGMWKEQGEATLQNGQYVGNVGHFTFWNCDIPGNFINLEATLIDGNGNSLNNVVVKITVISTNDSRSSRTDNTGMVSGGVPYNKSLVLAVKDDCGNILYAQNIGPYISNINLGTITINTPNYISATYNGTIKNCNNSLISNGFAKIIVGTSVFYKSLVNGTFSMTVPSCIAGTTISIKGVDITNQTESNPYTTTLTSGTFNIGNLYACGNIAEYISFNVDGTPHTALTNLYCQDSAGYILFRGITQNSEYITFAIGNNGGNYTLANTIIYSSTVPMPYSCTVTAMNVTSWASTAGMFANGNFSANYQDSGGNPHTLIVNYHVLRTN